MTGTTATDDDYRITHSPLEREVTRDGITVEICIYRGDEHPGWILEVEDQNGGSTVWEELPTDQAALDFAMKTIEEDGIASFAESRKHDSGRPEHVDPGEATFTGPLPFAEDELAELDDFLGDRSIEQVVGRVLITSTIGFVIELCGTRDLLDRETRKTVSHLPMPIAGVLHNVL